MSWIYGINLLNSLIIVKTRLISIESQPKKSCFVAVVVRKVVVVCIILFVVVVLIDVVVVVLDIVVVVVVAIVVINDGPRNLTSEFYEDEKSRQNFGASPSEKMGN